ncbi:SHQ1-like protein [Sesbania bispinosa]|nr:SHQ1-like protein [Sesbania bispinosa]
MSHPVEEESSENKHDVKEKENSSDLKNDEQGSFSPKEDVQNKGEHYTSTETTMLAPRMR